MNWQYLSSIHSFTHGYSQWGQCISLSHIEVNLNLFDLGTINILSFVMYTGHHPWYVVWLSVKLRFQTNFSGSASLLYLNLREFPLPQKSRNFTDAGLSSLLFPFKCQTTCSHHLGKWPSWGTISASQYFKIRYRFWRLLFFFSLLNIKYRKFCFMRKELKCRVPV